MLWLNAPLSVVCFIYFFGLCAFTGFRKDGVPAKFPPPPLRGKPFKQRFAQELHAKRIDCHFVRSSGAGTTSQLSCNSLFFYTVLWNVPHFPCCVQSFGKSRESMMIESASHPTPLPKGGAASKFREKRVKFVFRFQMSCPEMPSGRQLSFKMKCPKAVSHSCPSWWFSAFWLFFGILSPVIASRSAFWFSLAAQGLVGT